MPIAYARRLVGQDRTAGANRQLGVLLAFVAGATNGGAFLAIGVYTSHMTGLVSAMADQIVLGGWTVVVSSAAGLLSFTLGAALTALLVNGARRRGLRSLYAAPLLCEAALLLVFGVLCDTLASRTTLFVPVSVAVLCCAMGLQNALISKISKSEIRTTHVTGLVTDLGIELGKGLYWNRLPAEVATPIVADKARLVTLSSLLLAFFVGSVVGAVGFSHLGGAMTVFLAIVLLAPAVVPAVDDLKRFIGPPKA